MGAFSAKADAILDAAEIRARRQGYQGFSFRDLAADVGIKSSSVHYHFASKECLAAALTRRYSDRFLASLGEVAAAGKSPAARLKRYAAQYRKSLVDDDCMCLCGLFGAEIDALPAEVGVEVRRFFELNLAWLKEAMSGVTSGRRLGNRALQILAGLEGGLILARALGDIAAFDRVVAQLLADLRKV